MSKDDFSTGPFLAIEGVFWIPPRETPLPENFNYVGQNKKGTWRFSNPAYKKIFEDLTVKFKAFPNCCDHHKQLADKYKFEDKMSYYSSLPIEITRKIAVTVFLLKARHNSSDWLSETTDLIEWFEELAGSPSIGHYEYRTLLKYCLENPNFIDLAITDDQRITLLEYVKDSFKPIKKIPTADWNELYFIFRKWQNLLPSLQAFDQIKNIAFPMQLVLYDTRVNRYSMMAKSKSRTVPEFIEALINLTKGILEGINSAALVKEGKITDIEKHTIEVLGENHKIKQAATLRDFTGEEMGYVEILQKWMENEEVYFLKLRPWHKKIGVKSIKSLTHSKPALSQDELALKLIYTNQKISRGKTANKVAKENGHTSGHRLYNLYCKYLTKSNRTGAEDTLRKSLNKVNRIKRVIQELSGPALERAESELKILEIAINRQNP